MNDDQNKNLWSDATKVAFFGVALLSVGVIVSWVGGMNFNSQIQKIVGMNVLSYSQEAIDPILGKWKIFETVCSLGCIAGYLLFMLGLGKFGKILNEADGKSVEIIRIAVIVAMILNALMLVVNSLYQSPFVGKVASGIFMIVYFLMLKGYWSLKISKTFPDTARSGVFILAVAMMIAFVGALIGVTGIPVIHFGVVYYFRGALYIIAFVMMVAGWWKIKTAEVDVSKLQVEPEESRYFSDEELKSLEQLVVNSKEGGFSLEQIQALTNLSAAQINEILKRRGLMS